MEGEQEAEIFFVNCIYLRRPSCQHVNDLIVSFRPLLFPWKYVLEISTMHAPELIYKQHLEPMQVQ